jgi:hypothetical protein
VSASTLVFDGEREADIRRRAIALGIEYQPAPEWTVTGGAGVSLGGDLHLSGVRHAFGPGPVLTVGGAYRLLDGAGPYLPFLLFGMAASVSTVATESSTQQARLTAVDVRASLTVGKLFLRTFAPYAALRGFAGPVFWRLGDEDLRGSDRHHFAIALGAIATTGVVDAFVEVSPLGERSATVGASVSF